MKKKRKEVDDPEGKFAFLIAIEDLLRKELKRREKKKKKKKNRS